MTSMKTIQRRFATPNVYNTLLILSVVSIQYFGGVAEAEPVIYGYSHFTDRYASNSIPGFLVGDKVQTNAALDSSDPVGSPTISVEAVQGGSTLALEFSFSTIQIYPGLHLYSKIFAFDPGLLGSWEIIPTDSTGIGPSVFTPAIAEPEFVPFLENVTVIGTAASASVSWDLPSLDGFDVDRVYVRVVETTTGNEVFQSSALPVQQTSYQTPTGVLTQGVVYAFRIMLTDIEGGLNENRSNTFSEPFRLTVTGDYNQDGVVDAADYTVWRDQVGGTALLNRGEGISGPIGPADYLAWKSNFGTVFGAGSGAPLPSAVSLSASTPETEGIITIAIGVVTTGAGWPRRKRSPGVHRPSYDPGEGVRW